MGIANLLKGVNVIGYCIIIFGLVALICFRVFNFDRIRNMHRDVSKNNGSTSHRCYEKYYDSYIYTIASILYILFLVFALIFFIHGLMIHLR